MNVLQEFIFLIHYGKSLFVALHHIVPIWSLSLHPFVYGHHTLFSISNCA